MLAHLERHTSVAFEEGLWIDLQSRPEFIAKKVEDRASYAWDGMIYRAHEAGVPEYERVARELARPDRLTRRFLAKNFLDAWLLASEDTSHNVFRRVFSTEGTTYCFMFMDQTPGIDRRSALADLCFVARGRFPDNALVVGIATEKAFRPQSSYDFGCIYLPEWTPELAKRADEISQRGELLSRTSARMVTEDEYPAPSSTAD